GGEYQGAQKAAYCDPFAAKTGARVIQDGPVSNTKLRVLLEAESDDWNVIVSDDYMMTGLQMDGLISEVDTSIVDMTKIAEPFRFAYGASCSVGATLLAFAPDHFEDGKGPQTWADLFDLEKFPGTRMLSRQPIRNIELALLADGVAPADLYPLDVERALKKLDEIKDNIIFYESNSQSQQLISDGAAACGTMYSNRAFGLVKNGGKVGVSWDGHLRNTTLHIVPKAIQEPDIAWALINETLNAENQAHFANLQASAPTNPDALALVDEDVRPWLATHEENMPKGVQIDPVYWQDQMVANTERWQEWMLL
ncbi:MAG: extracellular solute-binding protein, partial [Hyphomicrobiaceae bacterium]